MLNVARKDQPEPLTERQLREIEFHRAFAEEHAEKFRGPIEADVVVQKSRRWWNAYWHTYTLLLDLDLKGKRVLVPGSGAGPDAYRLSLLGADVYAFDISPEMTALAKERLNALGARVNFAVYSLEKTAYPDHFFDVVFFADILHHVDIPAAMTEVERIAKPGALLVGMELYTHDALQKIRESRLVKDFLYERMRRFIYRTDKPYITADEHKINQLEFQQVTSRCSWIKVTYFNFLLGRLFPSAWPTAWHKADRVVMRAFGAFGSYFAGRVVFVGRLRG